MIETNHFPNILLYGPPGTGKTTTIINLVNNYQKKHGQQNKGLMIHLNASDERGIDIIRSQIYQFVNSNSLFKTGMKFVILDEVDYMTKNAQQALKNLLHNFNHVVRFCLICNYISRIDESLQNEFILVRFNQLPEPDIITFLENICQKEQITVEIDKLKSIQSLFKSDIRSMINYLQSNQLHKKKIIDNDVWAHLTALIQSPQHCKQAINQIHKISVDFNIEGKNIIKDYLNYIIHHRPEYLTAPFLKFTEFIMHLPDPIVDHVIHYSVLRLNTLFVS